MAPLTTKGEKAISDLFKMVDANKNGVLEKAEQKKAKKKLHSMMLPRARWTWKDMDSDGDGKISVAEWHEAMQAICDKVGEDELLSCIIRAWSDHPLAVAIESLWEAAEKGDCAGIEAAIEAGADVNSVEKFLEKRTALYWATTCGHVEAVKTLIQWGANVDQPHNHNRTALLLAAQRGYLDVMRLLLDKGADIRCLFTVTGSGIHNALHIAAHEGNTSLISTLLAAGADANAKAHSGDMACKRIDGGNLIVGKTPLEVANAADQTEAASILQAAGAA